VKTLARLLSLPARGRVAHPQSRGSSQIVNDEEYEVLQTGALWDEPSELTEVGAADRPGRVT
jgi:hypothetical protein